MKILTPLLLSGLIFSSCAPAPTDIAKIRKDIEAINQKATKEMLSGAMDTTYAQYTDDAISMPNNEPMIRGKEAFREYGRKMMAMGMKFTKVQFNSVDVQASGQFAYEVGTYEMTFQMGSMPEMSEKGKYLTIYQHAPDGSWKTKVETWNSDAPLPMPPSGK
jgi:ketosteroid isomerase-like protein